MIDSNHIKSFDNGNQEGVNNILFHNYKFTKKDYENFLELINDHHQVKVFNLYGDLTGKTIDHGKILIDAGKITAIWWVIKN